MAARRVPYIYTKRSAGVVLCRPGAAAGRIEAIFVLKRTTYAFGEFVHGRYRARDKRYLLTLFDAMTPPEILVVRSLDFQIIWYHAWPHGEGRAGVRGTHYHKCCAKFQNSFMSLDGGRALCHLLAQVNSNGTTRWEIPKGRKKSQSESKINCALREFGEETGIGYDKYHLIPTVSVSESFVQLRVRYIHTYFAALVLPGVPRADPVLSLARPGQMSEVSAIRWLDVEQLRLVDIRHQLETLVSPVFRAVKRRLKGVAPLARRVYPRRRRRASRSDKKRDTGVHSCHVPPPAHASAAAITLLDIVPFDAPFGRRAESALASHGADAKDGTKDVMGCLMNKLLTFNSRNIL